MRSLSGPEKYIGNAVTETTKRLPAKKIISHHYPRGEPYIAERAARSRFWRIIDTETKQAIMYYIKTQEQSENLLAMMSVAWLNGFRKGQKDAGI